jgi:hypothetical protein
MKDGKKAERKAKRVDKRIERKYEKVDKKMEKAKDKSPKKRARLEKKYGYNYESAESAGLGPDSTGHWPSRNPNTGEILKGRKHPSMSLTKKGEKEAGYKITRKKGKMYSHPKKK